MHTGPSDYILTGQYPCCPTTKSQQMSKVSIAVFGLNGALGKPTLEALKSDVFAQKFQFPVLAVTRDSSKYTSDKYVKYITGDYVSNQDQLIEELKGVDVIVELLRPSPELFAATEKIVTLVKPKLFIPSQFGVNLEDASKVFPGFLQLKRVHSDNVQKAGVKVVDIYTSFFAGGAYLYDVITHVGGDAATKTVTYFGSPDSEFSFTSLADVGRVIASLASKASSDLPSKVSVESGKLKVSEVVERYEETHDIKFDAKQVPVDEVLKEANEVWSQGFNPAKFLYYLHVFIGAGLDHGALFSKNDDELVNPGESLWKWDKF